MIHFVFFPLFTLTFFYSKGQHSSFHSTSSNTLQQWQPQVQQAEWGILNLLESAVRRCHCPPLPTLLGRTLVPRP
jgi:hypothetical protein